MAEQATPLIEQLRVRFGAQALALGETHGQTAMEVAPADWLAVCTALRDGPGFAFEQLIDLCGVDHLGWGQTEWDTTDVSSEGFSRGVEGQGPGRFSWEDRPLGKGPEKRFAAVAQLLSIRHNRRLRLRCFAADDALPVLPSLVGIWPGVNWFEREAFDLFGIVFEGHPDLRRILTDYGFVGHPFRKDFPLIGNVTVRYDAEKKRVVYEPVEIEPRVLVPRVVREDSRWIQASAERAQTGQAKP